MAVDPSLPLGGLPRGAVDPFSSLAGLPHKAVDLFSVSSSLEIFLSTSPVYSTVRSLSILSNHSRTSLRKSSVHGRSVRSSSMVMSTRFSEPIKD